MTRLLLNSKFNENDQSDSVKEEQCNILLDELDYHNNDRHILIYKDFHGSMIFIRSFIL